MVLLAASLVMISRNYPAINHYVNGEAPVEKPEDKNRIRREENLHKRVAKLENDVQAANDDSTAWMERYHEQCIKNRNQSRQIEKAATSLGSQLTYLDLRAQIKSLKIKCNSLSADLRDSERNVSIANQCQKQMQVRLSLKISTLERRERELRRHGRQNVPTIVQATELKREKAESAILRDILAQKDRELRAAADTMSHLEAESAQNQASFDKVKHELDDELILKNKEINRLREKAAKDLSQLKERSAQNQTSFNKLKHDLDEELIQKNNEIRNLREKTAEDMTISRTFASDLEQQLGAKTRDIERKQAELSDKCAEVKRLQQKVTSLKAREASMESETLAPTPSGLAPTASEGMDVDSPLQMQIEIQSQTLAEQGQKMSHLEDSNRVLNERLHSVEGRAHSQIEALERDINQLKEINHELRHGDHEMSDDTHEMTEKRVGEVIESYSQTINMQRGQLARLQKENDDLRARVGQNESLGRGGRELLDASIARLGKEKEDMNMNLQKARKLSDNLKKERDQLREAKTKITHENSELTKSQRQNVEELKKLREEKATLVEKCASLQKNVEGLSRPHEEENNAEETMEETMEETIEETMEETMEETSQENQPSPSLPLPTLTQLPPPNPTQLPPPNPTQLAPPNPPQLAPPNPPQLAPPNATQLPPPNPTQLPPANPAQPPAANPAQPPPANPTNDLKRSAPDDEEVKAIDKRVKRDQPDSSNA